MVEHNRFDRIKAPPASKAAASGRARDRDREGKEALYSVAPTAPPAANIVASCQRCGVERGLDPREALRLLARPFLINPAHPTRIWSRCPTCDRRSWLQVRPGQALRGLLRRGEDASSPPAER